MRTEYHEVSGVSSAFYPEFQGVRRPKNVVGRPAPLSNLLFLPVSGHAILGVWRPGHLKNFWKIVEDGFNKEGTTKAQSHAVKIAIEKDSEGRDLSAEQQEFFKDSKIVDEECNLKVVYHGSMNDFTIFVIDKYT